MCPTSQARTRRERILPPSTAARDVGSEAIRTHNSRHHALYQSSVAQIGKLQVELPDPFRPAFGAYVIEAPKNVKPQSHEQPEHESNHPRLGAELGSEKNSRFFERMPFDCLYSLVLWNPMSNENIL
jgi:hypothetical protein